MQNHDERRGYSRVRDVMNELRVSQLGTQTRQRSESDMPRAEQSGRGAAGHGAVRHRTNVAGGAEVAVVPAVAEPVVEQKH